MKGAANDVLVSAAIFGNLAGRLSGDDRAAEFLTQFDEKLKPQWPYPCLEYLRGKLDEAGLSAMADDAAKATEVHVVLGLDALAKERTAEAKKHLQRVVDEGERNYVEYIIADVELKRLAKVAAAAKK